MIDQREDIGRDVAAEDGWPVVALVSSAGGLKALAEVLNRLPAHFPAPILIVQHLDRRHPSILAQILARGTKLIVRQAHAGDQIQPGVVHVAPPDEHLLVGPDGALSLSHAKLVHFVRPSGDLLLESLAASYGRKAIAVILTGSGSDGAQGVRAVKEKGGVVIAQEIASAEYRNMPEAAVQTGCVDHQLPLEKIGPELVRIVNGGITP